MYVPRVHTHTRPPALWPAMLLWGHPPSARLPATASSGGCRSVKCYVKPFVRREIGELLLFTRHRALEKSFLLFAHILHLWQAFCVRPQGNGRVTIAHLFGGGVRTETTLTHTHQRKLSVVCFTLLLKEGGRWGIWKCPWKS